jgi:hypothetical protein
LFNANATIFRRISGDLLRSPIKEEREHEKKAAKKEIEREKDALDKAKDKLDDEH